MHETQASEGRTGVSACLDLRPSSVSPLLTTALSVVGFILRVIYIWSLATPDSHPNVCVSWGSWDRLPQTSGIKQQKNPPILEVRGMKSRYLLGWFFWRLFKEHLTRATLLTLGGSSYPWLSLACICVTLTLPFFPVCLCASNFHCLSLIRTLVIGFRADLKFRTILSQDP